MISAIWALVIDTVIGDPKSKLHPVAVIGSLIALLEKSFYRAKAGATAQIIRGGALTVIVLAAAYATGTLWVRLSRFLATETGWSWLNYALIGLGLSFMIAPAGLAKAGQEIYNLLSFDNLSEARQRVGMIVGRDTENLTATEIVRATVETIAENTVDGVISPLFFFALGGLPLAVLYRAANTMDSMLGYKNERYLYFGRIPARLDDVLNFIPARLTAVLFIMAAGLLHFDHRHAFKIMQRDANKHPSPNGGYAEATLAGALHIRLGGENYYFGQKHFRAYMGDAVNALSVKHIAAAINMMYTATVIFLILLYVAE